MTSTTGNRSHSWRPWKWGKKDNTAEDTSATASHSSNGGVQNLSSNAETADYQRWREWEESQRSRPGFGPPGSSYGPPRPHPLSTGPTRPSWNTTTPPSNPNWSQYGPPPSGPSGYRPDRPPPPDYHGRPPPPGMYGRPRPPPPSSSMMSGANGPPSSRPSGPPSGPPSGSSWNSSDPGYSTTPSQNSTYQQPPHHPRPPPPQSGYSTGPSTGPPTQQSSGYPQPSHNWGPPPSSQPTTTPNTSAPTDTNASRPTAGLTSRQETDEQYNKRKDAVAAIENTYNDKGGIAAKTLYMLAKGPGVHTVDAPEFGKVTYSCNFDEKTGISNITLTQGLDDATAAKYHNQSGYGTNTNASTNDTTNARPPPPGWRPPPPSGPPTTGPQMTGPPTDQWGRPLPPGGHPGRPHPPGGWPQSPTTTNPRPSTAPMDTETAASVGVFDWATQGQTNFTGPSAIARDNRLEQLIRNQYIIGGGMSNVNNLDSAMLASALMNRRDTRDAELGEDWDPEESEAVTEYTVGEFIDTMQRRGGHDIRDTLEEDLTQSMLWSENYGHKSHDGKSMWDWATQSKATTTPQDKKSTVDRLTLLTGTMNSLMNHDEHPEYQWTNYETLVKDASKAVDTAQGLTKKSRWYRPSWFGGSKA